MEQEVFLLNLDTKAQVRDELRELIRKGYHIDAVSHEEIQDYNVIRWSCLIVATMKNEPIGPLVYPEGAGE